MKNVISVYFLAAHAVSFASAATVNFADASCNKWKSLIQEEMQFAQDIALAASKDLRSGGYFEKFFAPSLLQDPQFGPGVTQSFERIEELARTGAANSYTVTITCKATSTGCTTRNWLAHMNDKTKIMTLCPRFFKDPAIKGTKARLAECKTMDLTAAHRTRSAILVHEFTHTSVAMMDGQRYV